MDQIDEIDSMLERIDIELITLKAIEHRINLLSFKLGMLAQQVRATDS